jgi:hypothetical protein
VMLFRMVISIYMCGFGFVATWLVRRSTCRFTTWLAESSSLTGCIHFQNYSSLLTQSLWIRRVSRRAPCP